MKCLFSIMLVLLLPLAAISDWIEIDLKTAVATSDIIVVGTLHGVSEKTVDNIDYGKGEITVSETLLGTVAPNQELFLVWQNESNVICPRVEHKSNQDEQLIWLLTIKPDGKVEADNPGRVVAVKEKDKVLELIRKKKADK